MSQDVREAYQVQAEHENLARAELMEKPLPAKGEEKNQHEVVGRKGLQKLSARRLVQNFSNAKSHPVWSAECQMADRSFSGFSVLVYLCYVVIKAGRQQQYFPGSN